MGGHLRDQREADAAVRATSRNMWAPRPGPQPQTVTSGTCKVTVTSNGNLLAG